MFPQVLLSSSMVNIYIYICLPPPLPLINIPPQIKFYRSLVVLVYPNIGPGSLVPYNIFFFVNHVYPNPPRRPSVESSSIFSCIAFSCGILAIEIPHPIHIYAYFLIYPGDCGRSVSLRPPAEVRQLRGEDFNLKAPSETGSCVDLNYLLELI